MSICSTGLSDYERREAPGIGHNGGPPPEPLTVTFPTAKKISGLGLTHLWKLGKEGRIKLVRVGRRTLIGFPSLKILLTPQAAPNPNHAANVADHASVRTRRLRHERLHYLRRRSLHQCQLLRPVPQGGREAASRKAQSSR